MTNSPFPSATLALPEALDLGLASLLQRKVDAVSLRPASAARAAVRRRAAMLRRRRRRLRHAVGSSTLAAGVAAGGLQHWLTEGRAGTVAPTAADARSESASASETAGPAPTVPAAPPTPVVPPLVPPESATLGWTWDATAGVAREAADPGAFHDGGRFHVYATSAEHCTATGCDGYTVPRFESAALDVPGRLAGDAMPQRPAWVDPADRAVWAPAAARVGDSVVLWFAATSGRPGDRGAKCLGAAVASSAEGPFVPRPEPLHCVPGWWAIDPAPVLDEHGWTLLWRQDDPDHPTGAIVSAPLRPDGLALAGTPRRLLAGERPWEDGYPGGHPGIGPVENPAMARHPDTGEWLLTWSANRWETRDYATGLATCDSPAGPCRRIGTDPWLRTSAEPGFATAGELGGAGGLSFTSGPDGALYAVLHAYAGGGSFPAPRAGWAYRVEAIGPSGYRLADIVGNQPAPASVNGT